MCDMYMSCCSAVFTHPSLLNACQMADQVHCSRNSRAIPQSALPWNFTAVSKHVLQVLMDSKSMILFFSACSHYNAKRQHISASAEGP